MSYEFDQDWSNTGEELPGGPLDPRWDALACEVCDEDLSDAESYSVPDPAEVGNTICACRRCAYVSALVLQDDEERSSHERDEARYLVRILRRASYDPDIRVECTHGIHFFVTRQEAEEYPG